jgi:hypothetical protein
MQNSNNWAVLNMSWRKIVEAFSARKFTFAEDRLPALLGIARDIMSKDDTRSVVGQGREYLAGYWRDLLDVDLTWIAGATEDEDSVLEPRIFDPEAFRSPTWSWCNSRQKVMWLHHANNFNMTTKCTVERASTKLKSLDSFGGVEAGFLDLVGPIGEVDLPTDFTPRIAGHWYTISMHQNQWLRAIYSGPVGPEPTWNLPFGESYSQAAIYGLYFGLQIAFDQDSLPNNVQISTTTSATPNEQPQLSHAARQSFLENRYSRETCWLALTNGTGIFEQTHYYGLVLKPVRSTVSLTAQTKGTSIGYSDLTQSFRRIGVFRAQIDMKGVNDMNWSYRLHDVERDMHRTFHFHKQRYRVV